MTDITEKDSKPILFYSNRKGKYLSFSNFSKHPVSLKKSLWPTSEHYFQAMKFEGTDTENTIRLAKTPTVAKNLGRISPNIRKDWEDVKDDIMYEVCLAKFSQHDDIREILLGTGNRPLVEHTERDRYWGDGGDGGDGSIGKNMLGKTLMKVRDELRKFTQKQE